MSTPHARLPVHTLTQHAQPLRHAPSVQHHAQQDRDGAEDGDQDRQMVDHAHAAACFERSRGVAAPHVEGWPHVQPCRRHGHRSCDDCDDHGEPRGPRHFIPRQQE
eukprot:364523-Chlamydomonas_euryale.AAC.11